MIVVTQYGCPDPRQGGILRDWLEGYVLPAFASRILAVDLPVARGRASLQGPDRRPECDAYIAAAAMVHGLTMVTRNIADFQPMGVAVLNPSLSQN
ncbi:MAG: hypothetical protein KGJ78_08930 [Alphaproteobacteria bacterium]|nr:hypothetical protein [Alphaproteobacteria bacterium]